MYDFFQAAQEDADRRHAAEHGGPGFRVSRLLVIGEFVADMRMRIENARQDHLAGRIIDFAGGARDPLRSATILSPTIPTSALMWLTPGMTSVPPCTSRNMVPGASMARTARLRSSACLSFCT